jgi:GTP-binding protein
MEAGWRRGDLTNMESDSRGRARLEYRIPHAADRLAGEFMNLTRGTGLMSHVFDGYAPLKGEIPDAATAC